MPTLADVARQHTRLSDDDIVWLQLLVADWQIIADLSFADLILWLPDGDDEGYWAGAQQRPTTGPTAYVDDVVGQFVSTGKRPLLDQAWRVGRVVREGDPEWRDDVPVRAEVIPVRRDGNVVALIGRHTNLLGVRTPSPLELAYLKTAAELTTMIAAGLFPTPGQRSDHADSPRVGDGLILIDDRGVVTYASPNALSVYRRLGLVGDLAGERVVDITRDLVPPRHRTDEETLSAVLGGRVPRDAEIGNERVTLIARSVPLRDERTHLGAMVLMRDVTELRRRDRELLTKDATIREIHHRVKNNLQTVASLLRLQSRRVEQPEARGALDEAVRRVGSIALVHETLSQLTGDEIDFDDIAVRLSRMVVDVSSVGVVITVTMSGRFGVLHSDVASALAMVLTEVLQNAAEHAYPRTGGEVTVHAERVTLDGVDRLLVAVRDAAAGFPADFDIDESPSLGLSIVRTLVESELAGHLTIGANPAGVGTSIEIDVPL